MIEKAKETKDRTKVGEGRISLRGFFRSGRPDVSKGKSEGRDPGIDVEDISTSHDLFPTIVDSPTKTHDEGEWEDGPVGFWGGGHRDKEGRGDKRKRKEKGMEEGGVRMVSEDTQGALHHWTVSEEVDD